MKSAITAEFRKVFTVRSTYILFAVILALLVLFGFYISGWRVNPVDLKNPLFLAGDVTGAVNTISIFLGIITVLLVTHEYRYNTIMHTLTLSNSRSKVLFSKIITISVIAIGVTIIVAIIAPLLSLLGANLHHLHFVHQTLYYKDLIWKCLFYSWGYVMAGLVLAVIIRNQIGSLLVLLIVPVTIESLLSLILRKNTAYLPFTSLNNVIGQGRGITLNVLSPFHSALVFSGYLLIGWVIAWYLFLKRDAG